MTDYTRPELTDDEITQAQDDARRLIRKYGMLQAVKIIALLAIENVKLSKEVNEHRAARGIEPLKTYEV